MHTPLPITAPSRLEAELLHLPGLTRDELRDWLVASGHAEYRAEQILQWMYVRHAGSFAEMTNLSLGLRGWLSARACLRAGQSLVRQVSEDGTHKLLTRWPDGASVESVWIPEERRHTACLSSQAGCPVGCRFCASGIDGLLRNLTAGEIVEQALVLDALVAQNAALATPGPVRRGPRLTNIVFMGMGEPLANYDAVLAAIRLLNAPWGLEIGARKITLSTVGLPKQIRRLAEERLQINLALSLHAPDDRLRAELIPWARGIPITDLLDACQHYFERTGREITLEYVLLSGVNDGPAEADALARIARQLRANVNLLRFNPVPGLPFERPAAQRGQQFQDRLRARGVNAHLRRSRGRDVQAACGQLRRAHQPASGGLPQ